jgi:hypothetical protein
MVWVNCEVDISDIEDNDLIEEIKDRGYAVIGDGDSEDTHIDLYDLYESYTLKHGDFDEKLRELFYNHIGRIA